MALDVAPSDPYNSGPGSSRRTGMPPPSINLGRTSSLPAPHPLIRIPSEDGSSAVPLSPIRSPAACGAPVAPRSPAPASTLVLRMGPAVPSSDPAKAQEAATKLRLAMDCVHGRVVAVKSVASTSLPRDMRQLENEQVVLEKLKGCPNIVQMLASDMSEKDGVRTKSLTLEYVSGGSVAEMMSKFGGSLPEQVARRYARGILHGLAAMHSRGLVHCDVKARNVLVCASTGVTKLCSFGWSSVAQGEAGERNPRKQRLQGTYQWMAPEVIRQEVQTEASDIWSFGCTMLEMLTGNTPWSNRVDGTSSLVDVIGRSQALPLIPADASPDCQKFLRSCLVRDPNLRPTPQQLLQDPFLQSPSPPKRETSLCTAGVPHSSGSPREGRDRGLAPMKSPLADRLQLERPKSPDGHDGVCRRTLERAALARTQSAVSSVQIWRRDDEPPERTSLLPEGQPFSPSSALKAQLSAVQPLPPSATAALSSAPSKQLPLSTGVSPALSQLLTPPSGIRMGPLMRQISRDAQEFVRLQGSGSSPGGSANAMASTPPALPRPAPSPGLPPTPGGGGPLKTGDSGHLPVAPSSPRNGPPAVPSPRLKLGHRRSGSAQAEGSKASGRSSLGFAADGVPAPHRRSGSAQIDCSSGSFSPQDSPSDSPRMKSSLRRNSLSFSPSESPSCGSPTKGRPAPMPFA